MLTWPPKMAYLKGSPTQSERKSFAYNVFRVASDVEAHVHDITVGYDVVFPLDL